MKPRFMLAGVIFWVVGAMCHFYHTKVLFWDVYPFQILTLPFIGVGALIFVYGLLARKRVVAPRVRRIKR